jgi:hypothetical protein
LADVWFIAREFVFAAFSLCGDADVFFLIEVWKVRFFSGFEVAFKGGDWRWLLRHWGKKKRN